MNENLREIACDWLKCCGFDGLYNDVGSCACSVDDLMPCCEPSPSCQAGYLIRCCECSNGDCDANAAGYDYIISEAKTCEGFNARCADGANG